MTMFLKQCIARGDSISTIYSTYVHSDDYYVFNDYIVTIG
jgi:hypothetical protein